MYTNRPEIEHVPTPHRKHQPMCPFSDRWTRSELSLGKDKPTVVPGSFIMAQTKPPWNLVAQAGPRQNPLFFFIPVAQSGRKQTNLGVWWLILGQDKPHLVVWWIRLDPDKPSLESEG